MDKNTRQKLMEHLARLDTERVNPETLNIDELGAEEIVRKINNEDKKVAQVVEKALPHIARAGQYAAEALRDGGRIVYLGAGTSGRLGVLDAAECPPTFGTDPKQVVGLISGGYETLILSKEGAEDHEDWAVEDLKKISLTEKDFVVGIAASVKTPYTNAGVQYAIDTGCRTAMIICNARDSLEIEPDVVIELIVGPEAITGSTRMKSGTAQKMALNMISTTAMVLLGKTYGNLMVDLQARSEKLTVRSRKILMEFLELDYDSADDLLHRAGGSVKTAIVMQRLRIDKAEAEKRLQQAGGVLKRLL